MKPWNITQADPGMVRRYSPAMSNYEWLRKYGWMLEVIDQVEKQHNWPTAQGR